MHAKSFQTWLTAIIVWACLIGAAYLIPTLELVQSRFDPPAYKAHMAKMERWKAWHNVDGVAYDRDLVNRVLAHKAATGNVRDPQLRRALEFVISLPALPNKEEEGRARFQFIERHRPDALLPYMRSPGYGSTLFQDTAFSVLEDKMHYGALRRGYYEPADIFVPPPESGSLDPYFDPYDPQASVRNNKLPNWLYIGIWAPLIVLPLLYLLCPLLLRAIEDAKERKASIHDPRTRIAQARNRVEVADFEREMHEQMAEKYRTEIQAANLEIASIEQEEASKTEPYRGIPLAPGNG